MPDRPTVLIVETRPSTLTFLEMTLSQEGMQVFSAVNLASALLQLRVLKPDLIILGLEESCSRSAEAVAQIRVLSCAPLLALAENVAGGPCPGVDDSLPYSVKAGQLCRRVAGLLRQ